MKWRVLLPAANEPNECLIRSNVLWIKISQVKNCFKCKSMLVVLLGDRRGEGILFVCDGTDADTRKFSDSIGRLSLWCSWSVR